MLHLPPGDAELKLGYVVGLQALGGTIDSNPCHMCSLPTPITCSTDPACVT